MGNVSRATIGISVSVAPRVEVVRAGAASVTAGEAGLRAAQPLCIWGNTALGTYQVTVLGDAPKGFSVRNASGEALAYRVEWASGEGAARPLSSGAALEGLVAATSARCGGGATAGLVVKLPVVGPAPEARPAGNLLLLVAPD